MKSAMATASLTRVICSGRFRPAIRQFLFYFALTIVPLPISVAWSADSTETEAGVEFFESKVRPILANHCYECHSAGKARGGLELDSRDGVRKGGDSGNVIVEREPDKSLLIEAVRYQNSNLQMPPKNRLPQTDVDALEKWVSLGAPDPRKQAAGSTAPAPTGMSIEEGRQFWSFRSVSNPPIPDVQNKSWVNNAIDAFILAKLEARGLKPAPRADKRTLIRRMTFDLIGLPPTPEEIQAFLDDNSPEAFQTVVERLLNSPHYGVRWGRHWLDVARYGDSNGLDENLAFGNAWRYRDYVVDSINRDKPFNRFLIEQLAGDLLPDANLETKTGTGFLVLGAKVLAEPDREKLAMDTIDEQIDTIGKAFLGMTLGCVRCHDHKFDPIKQSEYYSLAAIFKSTRTFADSNTGAIKHWNEFSFATDEELTKLKEVDQKIAEKKSAMNSYKDAATTRLRSVTRAKAAEYLVAAAQFDPSASLADVQLIASPRGLHPRILHHCRLHLKYHPNDPLFQKWHELSAVHDLAGIEQHYRPLFEAAEAALAELRAKDPKATTIPDERLELARAALYDNSGFLAIPPKPEFAFDDATLVEYHRLAEEARIVESDAPDTPAVMSVTDAAVVASLPIHIRGNHLNLGAPSPRDFPKAMRADDSPVPLPADHSGRLELAQWMASKEHPLTARVFVNRVWRWHFGAGIVASTENFGALGDRPSHPELLDFLASQFMDNGWSLRNLHRLILASNTYQMASIHPDEQQASLIDSENRLLWRFHILRLDAEQIRDSILAVTQRLDQSFGGKTVPLRNRQFVFDHTSIDHTKYDSLRRAIYLPVIRNNLYPLFEQFDFPDPTICTGNRNSVVVAPQALIVMNSDLIMDSADQFAKNLLDEAQDDSARIRLAYERALGRDLSNQELYRALAFLDDIRSRILAEQKAADAATIRNRVWSMFCQCLIASNEFMYLR